jgi:TonB family protein
LRRSTLVIAAAAASLAVNAPARAAEAPAAPELASPPRLVRDVPPELPPGTAFPAPQVTVVLRIDVSATGAVERVALLQGAGEPFDGAAMSAAQRYAFEPGRLAGGEPVPVTITYRLTMTPPPPPPRPAAPPPVRLRGRLLERGTRQPLAGVQVSARRGEEALASAVTGADGRFALEVSLPDFTLVAAVPDHERLAARVDARPGEEREETFYIQPLPSAYSAVVRGERVRREITKQVIPAEEVAQVAGSQGDTLKAVLNMPGAARPALGGGALVLRGSSPLDSAAFVDGLEIPLLYHFGGLRSSFAPRFLDAIEFVPGNFAADYGRLTGGIVNARVRDPARDMLRGEADFNLYDAGVALEGPVSKNWSVGGAFRRSWIDAILPLVLSSDSFSFTTAPRFYDYQFLATWEPDDRDKVRILFFGSQDRLIALLKRPASDPSVSGDLRFRIAYHELQASWSRTFSPRLRHESWVSVGMQETDTGIGSGLFVNLGLKTLAARSTFTWQALSFAEARAGLDLQHAFFDLSADVPQPPKEGEPPTPISTRQKLGAAERGNLFLPGAFVELRLSPHPSLDILPSLRADWHSGIRRVSLDPRLSARWSASPGTVLKAAAGLYQQPPAPDESDRFFGTPALAYQRSWQYSVGVEQRVRHGVDLDVTAFYKDLTQRVVRNAAADVDPSAPRYTNQGTGRIYGVEALLRARFGERFFGWIAYTFQRSFRTDGPGERERTFSFDQPHILTALGTYRPNARWALGARFRLVSGNPYTPVAGSIYDARDDVYVPLYGAVNSGRLGTFYALDLRVDRIWTFERWRLSAYLDVQNVTNHDNQEGWQYSFDYRQRTPLTGLPILPILGLKAEW